MCKDSTISVDTCLCAMVKTVAPKALFANCVESCSQEERNKLRGICGAGLVGGNDGEKKEVVGIKGTGSVLASTSSKNQTNSGNGHDDDDDDDNGGDSTDDNDDDDKPQKAPDVPVRTRNTTDANNRTNTSDKKNPDHKGSAGPLVAHTGWTGIAAAVVAVMLMGLI